MRAILVLRALRAATQQHSENVRVFEVDGRSKVFEQLLLHSRAEHDVGKAMLHSGVRRDADDAAAEIADVRSLEFLPRRLVELSSGHSVRAASVRVPRLLWLRGVAASLAWCAARVATVTWSSWGTALLALSASQGASATCSEFAAGHAEPCASGRPCSGAILALNASAGVAWRTFAIPHEAGAAVPRRATWVCGKDDPSRSASVALSWCWRVRRSAVRARPAQHSGRTFDALRPARCLLHQLSSSVVCDLHQRGGASA